MRTAIIRQKLHQFIETAEEKKVIDAGIQKPYTSLPRIKRIATA